MTEAEHLQANQYDRLFSEDFTPQWMIREQQARQHELLELHRFLDRAELEYRVSATKSHNKIVAQTVGNEYHNDPTEQAM